MTSLSYDDDAVDNFRRDMFDDPMLDPETDSSKSTGDLHKTSDDYPHARSIRQRHILLGAPRRRVEPALGFSDHNVAVPSGETVCEEQDAIQPNTGNTAGMTAITQGERRDTSYSSYPACHRCAVPRFYT